MNHCLLEVEVLEAAQIRYTQDNQTPIAEMTVRFDGLRPDDPPAQIRVVGWGSLAQDLQNRVQVGQRLLLEGRLRMNNVSRADGVKEKRAEFTLSRLHPIAAPATASIPPAAAMGAGAAPASPTPSASRTAGGAPRAARPAAKTAARDVPSEPPVWNSAPLVAEPGGFDEDDEIPF